MSRQNKPQAEVTPEMIKAGAEALVGYDDATASIEEYLPDVYRAMLAVRPGQPAARDSRGVGKAK